jgi:DUF4097 and DUF4098 domain-containing protein YvlB
MRRRSLAVPVLLILIGGIFLWRNYYPQAPVFDLIALYWPFLLIAWGLVRLVEVAIWRDPRISVFSGGEVALVVLICLAGMGLFEVHRHGIRVTPAIFGEQFEYPVSGRASAVGVRRIVFDNPRGTVHITGGDAEDVVISGHKLIRAYNHDDADRTNGMTPLELVPQGDQLMVYSHQDRAPGEQRVADDLDVSVPRGVSIEARAERGDYEISAINGDVTISGSRSDVRLIGIGGNVRLEVDRSDMIRAEDVKGNIDVQSSRGSDVELENIAGQVTINGAFMGSLEFKNLAKPLRFEGARNTELRVEAVPGSISMDLGELTAKSVVGPVRLVSQSRDIRMEDFTESLDLETQRGDIELRPGRVPLPKIEAHAGVGRIDLILPDAKMNFQLQATAERGEAINDFGPPIERETNGRTATLKGSVGDGPTIRITADRGSVSVRKEGTPASDNGPRIPQLPRLPKPPSPPTPPEVRL